MPHVSTMTTIERQQRRICRHVTSSRMAQACSSLLVPLMIAVFTIVTTTLQMNLAKQQRKQDFEIADQTRVSQNEIEDGRRAAEITAQKDQQMNTVLAAYLKDMAELLLSTNFSLTNKVIATVVRAKTLTTLGQLDGKRKAHIVRFLYEAQMITVGEPSIDLADADFSSVDLTNYKLDSASFLGCNLFGAIFHKTSLLKVDFKNAELSAASFDNSRLYYVSFYKANLTGASFIGVYLDGTNFGSSQLFESIFDQSEVVWTSFYWASLVATKWLGTNVAGVDFSYANLTSASITNDQIRGARKIYGIILPNGTRSYSDTNLLINGDAEGLNGTCDTSPWHVDSMIAVENSDLPEHIYDQCFFTRQSNTTLATMWQRVRVPNAYGEWIRTDVAVIQIINLCDCEGGFTMHLRQFSSNSNESLVNDTRNFDRFISYTGELFSTHPSTTEIELEIVFTEECGSWVSTARMSGICDNLKLTIWHRNYTL